MADGVTYLQEFNEENRLSVVTNTVTSAVTTFIYDGDGNRVKKVEGSTITYYVGGYYEKQGGTVTKYYYAGQRIAMRKAGVVYYLHGDHLGSTSLATTASGAEVPGSRTLYYPYGEVRWSSSTLPTDFTYTGQRVEQGLGGLMDYHARYYDPYLNRFISADTIVPSPQNPQAFNRYSYVLGNPLKYVDPSGHAGYNPIGPLVDGVASPDTAVAHPELLEPQRDFLVFSQLYYLQESRRQQQELLRQQREAEKAHAFWKGYVGAWAVIPGVLAPVAAVSGASQGGYLGTVSPGEAVLAKGLMDAPLPTSPQQTVPLPRTTRKIHDIGATYGSAQAQMHELSSTGWQNPFGNRGSYGQGFDDIFEAPNGDLVILEYKGGYSTLSGNQMSLGWVRQNIAKLRMAGDPMGVRLENAMLRGQLSGLVYTTKVVEVNGALQVQPTVITCSFSY